MITKMNKFVVVLFATIVGVLGVPTFNFQLKDLNDTGRILGGSDAPIGAYPYQASIQDKNGGHFCGGAIISSTVVVTAANCVQGEHAPVLKVLVGTNKLNSGGTKFSVERIVIHERFNKRTAEHDIALLILRYPFKYTSTVDAIPLETEEVKVGSRAVFTGWGKTSHPESYPTNLQHIRLKTVGYEQCRRSHGYLKPLFTTQVCTLNKIGEGMCHGDGGSPLAYNRKLIGVASWAKDCATGYPDVFTKISAYIDWIKLNSN